MRAYQLPEPTTVTLCLFSIGTGCATGMRPSILQGLELKSRRCVVERARRVLGRDRRATRSIERKWVSNEGRKREEIRLVAGCRGRVIQE